MSVEPYPCSRTPGNFRHAQPVLSPSPKGNFIMDATAKVNAAKSLPKKSVQRPSREEAEAAVRTLIAWAGDDPTREGLLDTPRRVTKAYGEFFSGYEDDPKAIL